MQVSSIKNTFHIPANRGNKTYKNEQEKDLSVKPDYIKADSNHIRAKYIAFLGMPAVQDKFTIATEVDEGSVPPTEEEIIAADNYNHEDNKIKEEASSVDAPNKLKKIYFKEIKNFTLLGSREIEAFKELNRTANKFVELSNKYENLLLEGSIKQGTSPEKFIEQLSTEKKEVPDDELEEEKLEETEEIEDEKGKFNYENLNKKLQKLNKIYDELNEETKVAFSTQIDELQSKLKLTESQYIDQRNKIVEANLKLVPRAIKKYKDQGIDYFDLVDYGNIGLIKAVEMYDLEYAMTNGTSFAAYAIPAIERTIEREIYSNAKNIRISESMQRTAKKLLRAHRELAKELDRYPSNEELSKKTGLDMELIKEIKKLPKTISFEQPTQSKGNRTIGKVVENTDFSDNNLVNYDNYHMQSSEHIVLDRQEKEILEEIYNKVLTEKERFVLRRRYTAFECDQMTQGQVGIALYEEGLSKKSLSRERVRQIEDKALEKIEKAVSKREQEAHRRLANS